MVTDPKILLVWYGDDFTGSTDALEFIGRAGAKAMLFLEPPTADVLSAYPGLQAFGIAGHTRSLHPEIMEPILLDAFESIKKVAPLFVHYKVCSTFDSSVTVGSIGRALDCGLQVFENQLVPVLGGMPFLGRYCVFGNLFAKMGTGKGSGVYRIDRHPSMMHHPVTPAGESDLRLHIGAQTQQPLGLIEFTKFSKPVQEWNKDLSLNERVVVVDCTEFEQLNSIGRWLGFLQSASGKTQFCIGGSGIEVAIGQYAGSHNLISSGEGWESPGPAERMLVISGSCSPVTTAQIEWAKANGFGEYIMDIGSVGCEVDLSSVVDEIAALATIFSKIIVHTGGKRGDWIPAEQLGQKLGSIALGVLKKVKTDRLVIAGGDTSSYAARAMKIDAVELIAPIVPGAPLCKVYSKDKDINGLQVSIKGGQVGDADFFGVVAEGNGAIRNGEF